VAPRALVALLVAVLVCGCGGDGGNEPRDKPPRITMPGVASGELVDVGGRSLYVECIGSGRPTVVLEAGFGGSADDWRSVLPELGRTTRTCAYDRAGLGASDPIPGVHDAGDEIRDLERLLERANIGPPYVVVGHSYGGLLARLFAFTHPDETAGVVLVDALGRDAWRRGRAAWPRSLAPRLRRTSGFIRPIVDGVDQRAGDALGNRIRSLDDMRLVVISAGRERELFAGGPPRLYRIGVRLWRQMQDELASLSSDRVHVVALRSDHFVADEQPRVVVAAVRGVVQAARDGARLPPCHAVFTGPDVRCLD
jgi:pimeloyl-ACP methyl ester carboxylesterase